MRLSPYRQKHHSRNNKSPQNQQRHHKRIRKIIILSIKTFQRHIRYNIVILRYLSAS